jgi:hypothetical protein
MTIENQAMEKQPAVAQEDASKALLQAANPELDLARGWHPGPRPWPVPIPVPYPGPGPYACPPGEILVVNPFPYRHYECRWR